MIDTICNLIRGHVKNLKASNSIDYTFARSVEEFVDSVDPVKSVSGSGKVSLSSGGQGMKVTKTHLICYVMSARGEAMTKEEILREVYTLQHKKGVPYKKTSNGCYFATTPDWRGDKGSLVLRGYIKNVGKVGNRILYGLTPKGHEKTHEYLKSL